MEQRARSPRDSEEPRHLTIDVNGNVYVSSNHAILRFTPDGTKNTFSSARGADEAWDLAVDRSGNVFVRNHEDAVLKFDPNGSPSTFSRDLSPDKQWEYKGGGNCKGRRNAGCVRS